MYNDDEIKQFVDMTKVTSAQSYARECNKAKTIYGGYQNLQAQANEARNQTKILNKTQEHTQTNTEQIQQLVECTKQNQISADKQYKACKRLTIIAVVISMVALLVNILQLFK